MGTGASVVSSSSSSSTFLLPASITTSTLTMYEEYYPPEYHELYLTITDILTHILQHDLHIFQTQQHKLLKDHKIIIQTLVAKSSSYLQQFNSFYCTKASKPPSDPHKYSSIFHEDLMKLCHGQYGEFLYHITLPSYESINLVIDKCFTQYTASELDLCDLLCVCTSTELKELKRVYPLHRSSSSSSSSSNNSTSNTLKELIQSKSINNLPFWEFLELLMIVDRRQDHEISTNEEPAIIKYVHKLYKAGLGNQNNSITIEPNNEIILSILAVMSRKQCSLINIYYEKLYHLTLFDAIHITYGGSAQRALILWISPVTEALVLCFQRLIQADDSNNQHFLLSLIARTDKEVLPQVMASLQSNHQINLLTYLSKTFKGNLHSCVELWCTSSPGASTSASGGAATSVPSFDHGVSYKISQFISSISATHLDPNEQYHPLYIISQDVKLLEEFHELLTQQMNHLIHYAKKHSIPLPSYDMTKFNFTGVLASSGKYSTSSEVNSPYFESLKECLEDQFILLDVDLNEYLEESQVWNYLISLQIGYHEENIPSLRESTGWVSEENTIAYRDLLSDITNHVLWTIEAEGLDVETIVQSMWKVFESQAEEQWNSCGYYGQFDGSNAMDDQLTSPDLVAYLRENLPTDENYTKEVFWENIEEHIRVPEVQAVKELWETNQTNSSLSSWEEAITQLQYLFTQIEYQESNNWIYLMDHSTKRLYWYNLQDNSSSWMSHEDQEYYLTQPSSSAGAAMLPSSPTTNYRASIMTRKTIVGKVRRASVIQAAQYRRMSTLEELQLQQQQQQQQQ